MAFLLFLPTLHFFLLDKPTFVLPPSSIICLCLSTLSDISPVTSVASHFSSVFVLQPAPSCSPPTICPVSPSLPALCQYLFSHSCPVLRQCPVTRPTPSSVCQETRKTHFVSSFPCSLLIHCISLACPPAVSGPSGTHLQVTGEHSGRLNQGRCVGVAYISK